MVSNSEPNVFREAGRGRDPATLEAGSPWQVIMAVGAEGGAISLCGRPTPAGWVFQRVVVDQTPTLIDEPETRRTSDDVTTWPSALELLDWYQWARLSPISMHPAFAEKVMSAVSERLADQPRRDRNLARWARVYEQAIGLPRGHRLVPIVTSALNDPMFAALWAEESTQTFRPFAAAVLELSDMEHLDVTAQAKLVREIVSGKRSAVLQRILGVIITPRAIKWLARALWQNMRRDDWETLLSIAATAKPAAPLGHVRRITSTLLRQYQQIPEVIRVPAVLGVASGLDVPRSRWDQLGGFLAKTDASWRAELLRSAADIRTNGDFWDLYFRSEGRYWRAFEVPDCFNRSELLEVIASPMEMEAEGLRMANCLGNRVSRVASGGRVYFRLRDHGLVDCELVRIGSAWVPGDILGHGNSEVPTDIAVQIRSELQRLAKAAGDDNGPDNSTIEDTHVEALCDIARSSFSPAEVATLREPLLAIRGRSRSWSDGAYAIFSVKSGTYVQCMSSPDGAEYLLEVASHKYVSRANEFLTAAAVELIESAGFAWPNGKKNFLRWFNVSTDADFQGIAELALAILAGVFRHPPGATVEVTVHVPSGE